MPDDNEPTSKKEQVVSSEANEAIIAQEIKDRIKANDLAGARRTVVLAERKGIKVENEDGFLNDL